MREYSGESNEPTWPLRHPHPHDPVAGELVKAGISKTVVLGKVVNDKANNAR